MKRSQFFSYVAFTLATSLAKAQGPYASAQPGKVLTDVAPAPSARFPAKWYPAASDTVYTEEITQHLPYVSVLVTSSHFVNPKDGTEKTIEQRSHQLRDGFGRRREETETVRPDERGKGIIVHEVTVHDTVSHCDFRWMEPWVVTLPQFSQPVAMVTCRPLRERHTLQNIWRDATVKTTRHWRDSFGDITSEPLGTRAYEGLQAEGTRSTKVLLDRNGARKGSITTEIWYSPGLDELLSMTQVITPAEPGAPPSFRLTQIKQHEPDPSLFYPPKAYRIESSSPAAY